MYSCPTLFGIGSVLCTVVCMASCAKSENHLSHPEQVKWGYEAENGPEVWGRLSPEYLLCSEGACQSPIDIANPTRANLPDITIDYQPTTLTICNNGHTIEAAYPEGSWIEVDDARFQLLQFHFHAPSEHTVASKSFDMEMHLVHASDDGELAVIGALIARGKENAAFNPIWAHLPTTPAPAKTIESVEFNADELLPSARHTYRYEGSLTTPPCSEGVKWFVLKSPIEMSEAQIAAFRAIIDNNNRPVQPLNGRELLEDISD